MNTTKNVSSDSLCGRPAGDGDASRKTPRSFYPNCGPKANGQALFVDHNGRRAIAGELYGDTFLRKMKDAHLLRQPRAIALQRSVYCELLRRECKRIRVLLVDSGEILETCIKQFQRHGLLVNRGFGDQIALELYHWQSITTDQQRLEL